MRIGPYARVLLIIIVILVGISVFITERAFYYRGLYESNPRIKIERHDHVVYNHLDPNQSDGYTCQIQKVTKEGVGMVCDSPDGISTISCTVGDGDVNPSRYFC